MTGRRLLLGLGVVAILAGATMLWLRLDHAAERTDLLRPDEPAVVAQGEVVYREACADCHGAELEGQPNWRERRDDGRLPAPPHDASGHTWHHGDALLFQLTKLGPAALAGGSYESDMPGFEGVLSDDEIVAALSYIKSRWPPKIRERHDLINRQAAR